MSVVSCTSSLRSIVVSWHFVLLLLVVEQMMEGLRQDASLTSKERRFRLARIGKKRSALGTLPRRGRERAGDADPGECLGANRRGDRGSHKAVTDYRRSVTAGRGAKRRGGGATDSERHRGGDSVCASCAQPSTNRGSDCLNQEQSLEVIKVTSTERESGRILEQIVDVPVPQVMKGIVEIVRVSSLVSACKNAPLK